MSNVYDDFFIDPVTVDAGVWAKPAEGADYRFKLRYAGRMRREAVARLAEAYGRLRQRHGVREGGEVELTDEEEVELCVDFVVDFVLVDWENVKGRDGKKLPFSQANARKLLTDLPDLARWMHARSQDNAYLNRLVEEVTGN